MFHPKHHEENKLKREEDHGIPALEVCDGHHPPFLKVVSMGQGIREVGNRAAGNPLGSPSLCWGDLNMYDSCGWSEFWVLELEVLDISMDMQVPLRRLQVE